MEFFIKFFIDGASAVDLDEDWIVYFVIFTPQTTQSAVIAQETASPSFVGYFTAYKFYSAIDSYKSRVSQVLVLPSFQRRGIATLMLESYYQEMLADGNCKQIAVESSSFGFQQVRVMLDSSNLLKDDFGKECIAQIRKDARFFPSPTKIKEFQGKFKLFYKQALDVIEFVLFLGLKTQDQTKLKDWEAACRSRIAKMNAQTLEPIQFKTKMPKLCFEGRNVTITPAMFVNILSPEEGKTLLQLLF